MQSVEISKLLIVGKLAINHFNLILWVLIFKPFRWIYLFMKIWTKLSLVLLSVGVTPLTVLSIVSIKQTRTELTKQAITTIETISEYKKSASESYYRTCESQVKAFSNSGMVTSALCSIDLFSEEIVTEGAYTEQHIERIKKILLPITKISLG